MRPSPGGHSMGDGLSELLLGRLRYFVFFSNQTGTATSQVHLNTCSCPSCILLMALSPINKTCSWLLDAACLPGTLFHPTLPYNMHEDFGMPTELLLDE